MDVKSFLFPKNLTCSVCGRENFNDKAICDKCLSDIKLNDGNICSYCGRATKYSVDRCDYCKGKDLHFDLCRSLYVYGDNIGTLVKKLKYGGKKYLAEVFSSPSAEKIKAEIPPYDFITFVPRYERIFQKREYNQGELIANGIAKKLDKECLQVLYKKKKTSSQVGLGEKKRLENLSGSFGVFDADKIKGKTILVVDDVLTTGSTLETISKVLKSKGAKAVYLFTVAFVDFGRRGRE